MTYFFIERMNSAKRNILNNEETNAFEIIYLDVIQKFYNKHELPALHVFGDGFNQGDASDEECNTLVAKNLAEKDEDGNYFFQKLDVLFCDAIDESVDNYNDKLKEITIIATVKNLGNDEEIKIFSSYSEIYGLHDYIQEYVISMKTYKKLSTGNYFAKRYGNTLRAYQN